MTGQTVIPAREGRAFHLESGDRIRIGLADGPQVADVFAFALPDLTELLSAEHTRSSGRTALRHRAHHTGLTVCTCYPSRRATCARNMSDGL